jgi:hypothetical protein
MALGKRGLNRNGHLVFSSLLLAGSLYVLRNYIAVSYTVVAMHLPTYLFGSLFADKIPWERPGFVGHRSFFHSRRMLWITILVLIPLSVWAGMEKSEYWYFATSFLLGHTTHLFGDSLTSRLPR